MGCKSKSVVPSEFEGIPVFNELFSPLRFDAIHPGFGQSVCQSWLSWPKIQHVKHPARRVVSTKPHSRSSYKSLLFSRRFGCVCARSDRFDRSGSKSDTNDGVRFTCTKCIENASCMHLIRQRTHWSNRSTLDFVVRLPPSVFEVYSHKSSRVDINPHSHPREAGIAGQLGKGLAEWKSSRDLSG